MLHAMTTPMTIDLSPEAAQIVRQAVDCGDVPDAKAAVEAALHGWKAERDERLGYSVEELRKLGDEGEASGPGSMSLDQIQREGFRRAGLPHPET